MKNIEFKVGIVPKTSEIIEVYEIQRNEGTNELRYKINPSDNFTIISYKDWCTKFN